MDFFNVFKPNYFFQSKKTLPQILDITYKDIKFYKRIEKGDILENYIVTVINKKESFNGRLIKGVIVNKQKNTVYTVSVLFEDPEKGFDDSPAKIYCSCPDFQFRFSWYLEPYRAFLPKVLGGGDLIPYKSKGLRPPVNPQKKPACCKHLVRFSTEILFKNLID